MSAQRSYEQLRADASNRRRAAVLKAAGLCFAEFGFKKTTTSMIAERAGVSKGLVFHFFGSKQDLFTCVVEDSLAQWSLLSDYRVSEAGGDALSELRSQFIASFDFIEQYPVLSLFSRQDEKLLAAYKKDFSRESRVWRRGLRNIIKRGIANNEIRKDIDVLRFSEIFHKLQITLIRNVSTQGTVSRYDRETVNLAVDLLLRGIRKNS